MRLIDYLPEVIRPYLEFIELMQAEQVQKDQVWTDLDTVLNQRFLDTMDAGMVSNWEEFLDLTRNSDAPMKIRKGNIRAKLQESPPYTWETLIASLEAMCGHAGYVVDADFDQYTIRIGVKLAYTQAIPMVQELAERIIPSNFDVDVYMACNIWQSFVPYTWGELDEYTWEQIYLDPRFQEGG